MTRKDYVLLAHALHSVQPDYARTELERNQWYKCVHAVADALKGENPRFDWDRFVTACETGSQ